jgi:hypothetical protein
VRLFGRSSYGTAENPGLDEKIALLLESSEAALLVGLIDLLHQRVSLNP